MRYIEYGIVAICAAIAAAIIALPVPSRNVSDHDKAIAAFNASAEDRYGFDDNIILPEPETHPIPKPLEWDATETESVVNEGSPTSATDEAATRASDSRPVVVVDTLHDGLHSHDKRHKQLCVPCDKFHDWEAENRDSFPLRFDVRAAAKVNDLSQFAMESGTPVFRFRGPGLKHDGPWYMKRGWDGPASLVAAYQERNPEFGKAPPKLTATPATESPVDLFTKFAGSGTFAWTPDKPVAGYADPETYIAYTKINAKVTAANGKVFVKFLAPLPEVSKAVKVPVIGDVWGKATVDSFSTDPKFPGQIEIIHSRGKLKLTIEALK
jgi:hypothetical protein